MLRSLAVQVSRTREAGPQAVLNPRPFMPLPALVASASRCSRRSARSQNQAVIG